MNLIYHEGHPIALNTGQGYRHIVAQLQEFVDAVQQNREPAITGSDGRAAIQVAEAAAGSMESGCAARLVRGQYELVETA